MGVSYEDMTGEESGLNSFKKIENNILTNGVKHDIDKPPLHLIPMDVMFEIADVMKHGAEKYPERNWEKGMEWHRPYRACLSHLIKWFFQIDEGHGKGMDESGHSHLYHAACNVLFLCAYQKRNTGMDNRP